MIFIDPKLWAVASGKHLGGYAVGDIVQLKEYGSRADYLVVHQGLPSSMYDASCDGTWLLRQDIAENRVWDSGGLNVLEALDIMAYLNGDWLTRYDSNVQNLIKTVRIPYRQWGGSGGTDQSGANGLQCKVFPLGGYEVGFSTSVNQYFPVDGAKLDYFLSGNNPLPVTIRRIANLNGSATGWWLRPPFTNNTSYVWCVNSEGYDLRRDSSNSYGIRPALILPFNTLVDKNNLIA